MCGSFFVACAPFGATRLERGKSKMHKKLQMGRCMASQKSARLALTPNKAGTAPESVEYVALTF